MFTNYKICVHLHATFGLNDRCIPIQYPSWSAKGFGEAIELLIARWMKLLTLAYGVLFWHTMPAGLHDLHYKRKCKN